MLSEQIAASHYKDGKWFQCRTWGFNCSSMISQKRLLPAAIGSKMCHPKLWREKEMGNGPHFWNNYTAGLMMIDDYYSLKRRQTTGIEQLWYRLFQGLHPCRRIGRGSPKIVLSSQAAQKKQFGTTNSIHLQNTDFSWVVFVWMSVRYTCVQYVLPHVVWLIDQGL